MIPGSGRSPGEGNGKPLQYSGLGKPKDRGTWWATVQRVAKSQKPQSDGAHTAHVLGQKEKVQQEGETKGRNRKIRRELSEEFCDLLVYNVPTSQ